MAKGLVEDEEILFFDRGALDEASKMHLDSQGFMHVRGTFTTVGVYKYRMPDGSIRSMYRPAKEVQSERFINSLRGCVVTNEHPPNKQPVTIRNVKQYQVGHAASDADKDGLKVDGGLTITEEGTINSIRQRVQTGLSVGYRCKSRYSPGVWDSPNGPIPYDYIQHGHVANHIAITSSPRGGLGKDGTALHLDSLEAEQLTEDNDLMSTVTMNIDGLAITLPADSAGLVKHALDKRDTLVTDSTEQLTKSVAAVATLEAANEKLTEDLEKLTTDSKSQENLGALVAARIEFNGSVKHLIEDDKLDAIDSADDAYESKVIDVILEANGVDLSEKAKLYTDSIVFDGYKRARFDALIASKKDDAHTQLGNTVVNTNRVTINDSNEPEYRKGVKARLKMAQQKRDGTHVEKVSA